MITFREGIKLAVIVNDQGTLLTALCIRPSFFNKIDQSCDHAYVTKPVAINNVNGDAEVAFDSGWKVMVLLLPLSSEPAHVARPTAEAENNCHRVNSSRCGRVLRAAVTCNITVPPVIRPSQHNLRHLHWQDGAF